MIERRRDRRLAANVRDFDRTQARESRPLRGRRAVLLLVAIFVAAGSGVAAFHSWDERRTATALRERGVVTEATVRKVDRTSKGGRYAIVNFRSRDGKARSAKIDLAWWGSAWRASEPRRGDVAPVRYDPKRPERFIAHAGASLDTRTDSITMIVSGGVLGTTVLASALFLRRRRHTG